MANIPTIKTTGGGAFRQLPIDYDCPPVFDNAEANAQAIKRKCGECLYVIDKDKHKDNDEN